ncbi:aminopeptidase P family protein [Bartonella sp. HY761]|uniref:aminopeptidase P family protein n=1 Tax=Bartonella sp. HY761 TaxID=2979330 RepID=UPI00220AF404|nr:aminopeptidase P family protein [Bartonella sp. HY761]UXN05521.1 aminopeptidase P family protein [Bartonella sp. HY761]
MFQTFDIATNPDNGKPRLALLRKEMSRLGLDGFIIPRADEHQGEYVPPHAQRLAWLTGFTGSAGSALVLQDKAYIFTDGRYSLQVRQQTDNNVFDYEDLISHPPSKWLSEHGKGLTIGFDPWLTTIAGARHLREAMAKAGGNLHSLDYNLVDVIWDDQPEPPLGRVTIQPLSMAGKEADIKLAEIQEDIRQKNCTATILTDPSSIAWLFNIRGTDVSNTPLPLSFAFISASSKPYLFIDPRKLGVEEKAYLDPLCHIVAPNHMIDKLKEIIAGNQKILLDANLCAEKIRTLIEDAGAKIVEGQDPAKLPRAIKNAVELEGARRAHLRDGVALVRFFSWLSRQSAGTQDEISAAIKLEEFRAKTAIEHNSKLEDLSFDTISGVGSDGAIIHYRVNTKTNRKLEPHELYLVDSGAQYRDGTTDVTRTVAICAKGGKPDAEQIRCFTLVLKGMINMSLARFPAHSRGVDLDILARSALWKAGLDYKHGTGHGVGSFLSVHEGPQSLSRASTQELMAGMIISNEPGYYREGAFGIRIENLLIVQDAEPIDGGEIDMHSFETLTLCPIDQSLIDSTMLTLEERQWLNAYHAKVYEKLSPFVSGDDLAFLTSATAELS